jgi:hypothetical protein
MTSTNLLRAGHLDHYEAGSCWSFQISEHDACPAVRIVFCFLHTVKMVEYFAGA